MVQYIFTPWRDRRELLAVRRQFYPHQYETQAAPQPAPQQLSQRGGVKRGRAAQNTQRSPTTRKRTRTDDGNGNQASSTQPEGEGQQPQDRDQRRLAVARVSMWMQRGNCPHMVESTALLMAAILSDEEQTGIAGTGTGTSGTSVGMGMDGFSGSGSGIGVMSSSYAVRAAYSAAFSRFVTGLLDSHQDKQRKMSMYGVAKSVGLPATFVELRHQATHEQLPSLTRLRTAAKKGLGWIWEYYWKHLPEVEDGANGEGVKGEMGEDVIMLDEEDDVKEGEGEGGEEGGDGDQDEGPAWRLYGEDEWVPKPIGVV
ncbi:Las1-like-domain-containing protein [Copromyces sp. CBS 386.78]|nr:Las1-like-domain-containing protein [Copromyces sp. CBS 386.78]